MKKSLLVFTVLVFFAALPVLAQTDSAVKPGLKQQFQQKVQDLRQSVKQEKTELQKNIKEQREAAVKQFEEVRKEAKAKVEAKRVEVKEKIQQLKDERKKAIALRVDEQLNRLNEQWTKHFSNVLNQLNDVLGKIELRAEKAKANGQDTTAVTAAIEKAKQTIATAKSAVEEQVKKSYIATIESEDKLKDAFKTQRDLLHKDLFGLRDGLMKDARKAVQDALQSLRIVPEVDK